MAFPAIGIVVVIVVVGHVIFPMAMGQVNLHVLSVPMVDGLMGSLTGVEMVSITVDLENDPGRWMAF